jgi:hypothetical protein
MKTHFLSFLRSPIGYASNFVASVAQYLPDSLTRPLDRVLLPICDAFCLTDGVQDNPLF